eukprot:TRINITY_DN4092_c0_g3_i1.p1 TRINITY_DN4092_c0_g3~~TRINITY_DN4092_c0_g3_i1.p1  ORF type:complete len:735 (+),score=216.29 TRINITY_DN4092_c0_g3_i1:98-2206(+)
MARAESTDGSLSTPQGPAKKAVPKVMFGSFGPGFGIEAEAAPKPTGGADEADRTMDSLGMSQSFRGSRTAARAEARKVARAEREAKAPTEPPQPPPATSGTHTAPGSSEAPQGVGSARGKKKHRSPPRVAGLAPKAAEKRQRSSTPQGRKGWNWNWSNCSVPRSRSTTPARGPARQRRGVAPSPSPPPSPRCPREERIALRGRPGIPGGLRISVTPPPPRRSASCGGGAQGWNLERWLLSRGAYPCPTEPNVQETTSAEAEVELAPGAVVVRPARGAPQVVRVDVHGPSDPAPVASPGWAAGAEQQRARTMEFVPVRGLAVGKPAPSPEALGYLPGASVRGTALCRYTTALNWRSLSAEYAREDAKRRSGSAPVPRRRAAASPKPSRSGTPQRPAPRDPCAIPLTAQALLAQSPPRRGVSPDPTRPAPPSSLVADVEVLCTRDGMRVYEPVQLPPTSSAARAAPSVPSKPPTAASVSSDGAARRHQQLQQLLAVPDTVDGVTDLPFGLSPVATEALRESELSPARRARALQAQLGSNDASSMPDVEPPQLQLQPQPQPAEEASQPRSTRTSSPPAVYCPGRVNRRTVQAAGDALRGQRHLATPDADKLAFIFEKFADVAAEGHLVWHAPNLDRFLAATAQSHASKTPWGDVCALLGRGAAPDTPLCRGDVETLYNSRTPSAFIFKLNLDYVTVKAQTVQVVA